MTYLDYLNGFNRWLESGNLPGGSQLMYFKLLNVFNRAGWSGNGHIMLPKALPFPYLFPLLKTLPI